MINYTFSLTPKWKLLKTLCSILVALSISFPSHSQESIGTVSGLHQALVKAGSQSQSIKLSGENIRIVSDQIRGNSESMVGKVENKNSYVFFNFSNGSVNGKVIIPGEKKSLKYYSVNQTVYAAPEDIADVICIDYPKPSPSADTETGAPPADSYAYKLESLPTASAVLMLDFDGHNATGSWWGSIIAQPADVTEESILQAWEVISEDYRPFKINITTNEAVYQAAPSNQRMRCIFTPTTDAAPGWGGVAYVNSFKYGGGELTPCWVFNLQSGKIMGETGSHELGHTLGLSHDGRDFPDGTHEEYYYGGDIYCPIMGASFSPPVTQWSIGEYQYANNHEDDIAIIADTANRFGFRPDAQGNTFATAAPLMVDENGIIPASQNYGIISTKSDADYFSFTTSGGKVNITVSPSADFPDLDPIVKLVNAQGTTIAISDPPLIAPCVINGNLTAGKYYLIVDGTGYGNPFTNGYSDYASVGEYTVSGNLNPGILREVWNNIAGSTVSTIPYTTATPDSTNFIISFEEPTNVANLFGTRCRGYIHPPTTGNYTFWIASDDNSELWLSTDDNPNHKVRIAYINGWTYPRVYNKYPSQQSASIHLVAGQKYYIETLHKEAYGNDNLSVGWQLPNGTLERPIPGIRLSSYVNKFPTVSITQPSNGAIFNANTNISINAVAADSNGTVTKVEFYQGTTKIGTDVTAPFSFTWMNVPKGNYVLTAKAYDNDGGVTTSNPVSITVGKCTASGTILWEYWNFVYGTDISTVPINRTPISTRMLTIFEGPTNIDNNYAARYRGYICVPQTGSYTFWIASDDNSELWLSTDDNPGNKVRIAYVTGWTYPRTYNKYPSQQSVPINLVAGKSYYIEALHKEAYGNDNLSVGWRLPNGTLERPIPGTRLSPFTETVTASLAKGGSEEEITDNKSNEFNVTLLPNPTGKGNITLSIEGGSSSVNEVILDIRNLQGSSMHHEEKSFEGNTINFTIAIDNKYPSGLYIVQVVINGNLYVHRLLIE